jgi:hypothetical protein
VLLDQVGDHGRLVRRLLFEVLVPLF